MRNQCQWGTPDKDTRNLRFVCLLKDTLGVSHKQLGRYVLERAPDLHKYTYLVASSEFMYAPLHCVGTIIKVGFDLTRDDGLTPKQNFRKWNRPSRNILIDPRRLTFSAVSGLIDQIDDLVKKKDHSFLQHRITFGR
jgi:hypothetical protein